MSDLVLREADFSPEWNPYKALHLEDDGLCCTEEIRKAYRKLTKKYHPDKVNWEKLVGQEAKVEKRWHNLVMAYETLSKQEKYNNWREWGHPDGNRGIAAIELMIPSFIFE